MSTQTLGVPGSNWAKRLTGRWDITVMGVYAGTLRASMEQVATQAASSACHRAAPLLDWVPTSRIPFYHEFVAWWCGLGDVAQAGPGHLLAVLIAVMCPVGGPVWASIVPVGTSVRALRSLVQAPGQVNDIPASRNAVRRSACQPLGMGLTVLIVDDSAPFRDVAQRLLERSAVQVVGVAATIAEAMAQIELLSPQVVLADIHLGSESGFDLARRLNASAEPGGPAVVLMSTHSEEEFADLIASSSAVGFVPKVRLSAEAILTCLGGRQSG